MGLGELIDSSPRSIDGEIAREGEESRRQAGSGEIIHDWYTLKY